MEAFNRWMYRSGSPNRIARVLNSLWTRVHKWNQSPKILDVLEVIGRNSGKPVQLPIIVLHQDNERYLVSMLGDDVNWVKNVRAADGNAALLKGGRQPVHLADLPVDQRAAILKRYCEIAPGGRSHFPISKDAPVEEFAKIAADYPVFRIEEAM